MNELDVSARAFGDAARVGKRGLGQIEANDARGPAACKPDRVGSDVALQVEDSRGNQVGDGVLSVGLSCHHEETAMPSFLVQCEMAFLVNMLRTATKQEICPTRVQMRKPPEGHWFATFLGCELEKGDGDVIVFANTDLCVPFISRNDAM